MSAVGSHAWARDVVRSAWRTVFGTEPTATEAQGVQAVASLETNYGRGQGVNNWGSVHCTSSAQGVPGTDTDAKGKAYATCFRSYPTPEAGAADFIRTMVKPNVRGPLRAGSATRVARAMHQNRYFELAPAEYAKRSAERAKAVAAALGEPVLYRPTNAFVGLAILGTVAGGAVLWYRKGYTHV